MLDLSDILRASGAGGVATVAALLLSVTLIFILGLATLLRKNVPLYAWLIGPLTVLICGAMATLSKLGEPVSANISPVRALIDGGGVAQGIAPWLIALGGSALALAASALTQGSAAAIANHGAAPRITPLTLAVTGTTWLGAMIITVWVAREAQIAAPWGVLASGLLSLLGACAVGSAMNEDKERAHRTACHRISVSALGLLSVVLACSAGIMAGEFMMSEALGASDAMLATEYARAALVTETHHTFLLVMLIGATLAGVVQAAGAARSLDRNLGLIARAVLAILMIGISLGIAYRVDKRYDETSARSNGGTTSKHLDAYRLPEPKPAAASIVSRARPGCLILHEGEGKWTVASPEEGANNPCATPDDALDGSHEIAWEVRPREEKNAHCPTQPGPLEGKICASMPPPTLLVSGDAPARDIAGHAWGDAARSLRILTHAPTSDHAPSSQLSDPMRWRLEYRSFEIQWKPHDVVLTDSFEEVDMEEKIARMIFGRHDERERAIMAISEDESGLFAVTESGVKRITLDAPTSPPGEGGANEEDASSDPVPMMRVLEDAIDKYHGGRDEVVIIPGAEWTVQQLIDTCAKVSLQTAMIDTIREASDPERPYGRCVVHDIPARVWFSRIKDAIEIEREAREMRARLKKIEISNNAVSKFTLHRYIGRQSGTIKKCYERALDDDGSFEGRVSAKFTVTKRGRLEDIEVTHDTLQHPDVSACVVRALSRVKIPGRRQEPAEVHYPISFHDMNAPR